MTEENKPEVPKMIEYRDPEGGLLHIYANNIQMASTPFDVRILFGQITNVTEEKIVVDQRVVVTMTWVEAKILADFLGANVQAFEALNGPMEFPKNLDAVVVPQKFTDKTPSSTQ